jgi:hypothetical protein
MPWSLARITQLAPASAFGWLFTRPCVNEGHGFAFVI